MTRTTPHIRPASEFEPKIITTLREGYGLADLRADAMAGLTVAVVALPLSMAVAIASGTGPERGLYTAIVGGFVVSALGGSRFQIGGPAGAFIVLVAACVARIGVDGMVLATLLSGVMLAFAGALRLGAYIRFIPYPVTVAFTAGIGLIILLSQIRDMFGLSLPGVEPAAALPRLAALWAARGTVTPEAVLVSGATLAVIVAMKRWLPRWPSFLIAVAGVTGAAQLLGLSVMTVEDRFGALPHMLPMPGLPNLSAARVWEALPFAVSFTVLGAITALLSASVADGLSSRRHRSTAELVAQGAANVAVALFGGLPVTGAVARTVTNIRAGSRGPVSGMFHAVFVLIFLMVAAPLMGFVPLAVFAGMLAMVAWNMADTRAIWSLIRSSRADAIVVAVTFALVVFQDLIEGIVVGFALGGLVFIKRMSDAVVVAPHATPDMADPGADVMVYRLSGPYFFGAAAQLGAVLDSIATHPRALVLDFAEVPFIDSTGAHAFALLARKSARKGGQLWLTATNADVRHSLEQAGLAEPEVRFLPHLAAVAAERANRDAAPAPAT